MRLVFVSEDAPEFARELPEEEWNAERDPDRIAQMLNDYDHPILLLQQMIWHAVRWERERCIWWGSFTTMADALEAAGLSG